jgi:predicted DNA-binding transcriptional regulator YafY
MASGTQIERSYRLVGALLQGDELDRQGVARLLGVRPAAADRHINALVATVPGIEERRRRHRRTIRFTGLAAPGAASRNLAAASCFGASLAHLFRGTPYETLLHDVRDSVTRRTRKPRDFEDARRKFLFITPAGELGLAERLGILDDLVEAVLKRQYVRMDYTGFDGEERSVEVAPWSIAIYDHQLYLLAEGESAAPRAYRLSRVSHLQALAKTFSYPAHSAYNPEQMFRDTFGIFIRGEDPIENVALRLSPRWRTYAHSHLWHSSQRVSADPGGGVTVRMRVRICSEFEAFVLGFGTDAEVLEPISLRDRIAQQVEALHLTYRDVTRGARGGGARGRRASQGDLPVDPRASAPIIAQPTRRHPRRARGTKPHDQTRR